MVIKFKLLKENPGGGNFSELQITECTYNGQAINKIILTLSPESKSIIRNGTDQLFTIKDVQNNEIEPNGNVLKINSLKLSIVPFKTDFLFAAKHVKRITSGWEIELEFIHFWNGEKIQKIHILGAEDQHRNIIEENKNRYLFRLTKVGRYDIISIDQTNKEFTIYGTDFQGLNTVPWLINLEEVSVKNLQVLDNNTYLLEARKVLTSQGLRDYEKIELVTNQRINEGEIISFTIPDLRIALQRDKEDRVLRVRQDYHSLTKIQPDPEEGSIVDQVEEEIQKFLTKYQRDDYQKIIIKYQKSLQKYSFLLNKIHSQSKASSLNAVEEKKIIEQQNILFHELEVFSNQNKFQKKVATLKEKYQDYDQISYLRQELKEIDQEFLAIEKKTEENIFSAEEYLEKNWSLFLQNDPKFQQILTNCKLNQSRVLDGLSWFSFLLWLQEDGTFDYFEFEKYIQRRKDFLRISGDLDYEPEEIAPGGKYEEWKQNKIKKSEALKAIYLDYLPEQWNDPQYEKYKEEETSRVLAASMIATFRRKWVPPLTNVQERRIRSAVSSYSLVDRIMEIQEERYLTQIKDYFKDIIEQELKKCPKKELDELDLTTYKRKMNNLDDRNKLRLYVKKLMMKIKETRSNNFSVEELKDQVKKNISEILTKSKLKTNQLHSQYQNWLTSIEKMKNKSEILQFEQNLTLLLEEINFFLQQKWFPNFEPEEKNQIKQVKDRRELEEQIRTLLERKKDWLTIWQINSYLQRYRELQNEDDQEYFLQKKQLTKIRLLLHGIISLNKEQRKLERNLLNTFISVNYSSRIKVYQLRFNSLTKASLKEREKDLQLIQELFQEWTREGKLSENEFANQVEVEAKLSLIRQGKNVKNLSVLNDKKSELNLLNLPPEISEENEVQTGNDFYFFSQQNLVLLTLGGLLLIFFWRWYRKRREKDPFW